MYNLEDFLEAFNNGDLDVQKYFNDYETWFTILKRKGLFDEIDPHNASDHEVWQNEYLLWLYENDREKYYTWIQKLLGDIEIEEKTNKAYWVGDREDLADLFCDNRRNDVSQDTIRSILSDDGDWWEPYWDTTNDVYRDVIEELTKENLEVLKEKIVSLLSGQKLSPETEEMELIAAEQGHKEYWEINNDSVLRIIDDKESMESLLDDELRELKSDLYSVHSNSLNSAMQDEVYDDIWNELSKYFEGTGKWYSIPHPSKKDTQIQKFKVPINDFEGYVNDYLINNKGYGNSGTLEYHGSFLEILREGNDCLSVRFSDYPDPRKVDNNINSYFRDYI
jgi:hypothetical protein